MYPRLYVSTSPSKKVRHFNLVPADSQATGEVVASEDEDAGSFGSGRDSRASVEYDDVSGMNSMEQIPGKENRRPEMRAGYMVYI